MGINCDMGLCLFPFCFKRMISFLSVPASSWRWLNTEKKLLEEDASYYSIRCGKGKGCIFLLACRHVQILVLRDQILVLRDTQESL